MSRSEHSESVEAYYDRNTSWFLRFGERSEIGSLHRAVWGPGVQSRQEALVYVDNLISEVLANRVKPNRAPAHLVDLGCGVGGTAVRLAKRWQVPVTGLTISRTQMARAQKRAWVGGVSRLCSFRRQDMANPGDIAPADVAFAIEAVSHLDNPVRVFPALNCYLQPGGLVIVCDDFETRTRERNRDEERKTWIHRFRNGWRLKGLLPLSEFINLANENGFSLIENRNLTHFLRLYDELPLYLLHLLNLIPFRSNVVDSIRGGAAGQRCLKEGWLEYRFLVFRKKRSAIDPR